MFSRRSESCPRLARKESVSQAPAPQQPLSVAPTRSCTLQDLGPEDRQKVAKLLKQVVDLGQEVQALKQERDELTQQAQVFAQREQELQEDKQQLHSEHQSLKRKLAQVLLVLRASQTKVAALEAIQQATPVAHCAVEVQTEPVDIIDSEVQSSIASNAPACAVCGPVQPAVSTAAQPAGKAEPHGHADSAVMHASLAIAPGGPPFLHVAPGAHVNITINHAPEPVTAAAAAVVPASVPSLAMPASAHANKPVEAGEAEIATAASPGGLEDGCNKGVASLPSPHYGVSEHGAVMGSSPAAPAVITIPTTTAATTAAGPFCTVAVSAAGAGPGAEVAQLDASVGSCSAMCTSPYGPLNANMPTRPVQQPAEGLDAHSGVLAPTALPKPPRAASTVASAGSTTSGKPTGPRNILVDATMQRFEAVPVHEVCVQSREVLTASPMIVTPSDEVVAVASRLLGMQAQHGLSSVHEGSCAEVASSSTSREPRSGRKVLSFDPAIGQSGAFYFVDVPDMGEDPAEDVRATVVRSKHLNRNDVGSVATGRQPPPQHLADLLATSMSAFDRVAAASPQSASQHLRLDSETTLRSWTDGLDASGCGRLGGPMGAPQHLHPKSNHRKPAAEPTAPPSPCSSYTTETTSISTSYLPCLPTPSSLPGINDTPASSSMSLSRMAVALEEVAQQQRWDVQASNGTAHSQETLALGRTVYPSSKVGHLKHLPGPGAPMRQDGRRHVEVGSLAAFTKELGPVHGSRKFQGPHTATGLALQKLRPNSAGSITAAAALSAAAANTSSPLHAAQDAASQVDAVSTCGNTSTWVGCIDMADRYDDSLVDILSQADEELEYQQQQQHHWQRPRLRPQGQRTPLQTAAVPLAGPTSVRSRGPVAPSLMSEAASTRLKQTASAEAILAANLYEENDVLSVILEQEGRV